MTDIFISYARQDHRVAKRLNREFHSRGWDVWWDQGLLAGQTFEEEIQRALDAAGCVIVLWSKHAIVSDWVKDEADEGRRRGILVPAKIEEVAIPLGFRRIHTESLIDWQGDKAHSGFVRLSRAVEGILERRGRAPAPKTPHPSPEKSAPTLSEAGSSSSRHQRSPSGQRQPLDPVGAEQSPGDRGRKSDDVAISWGLETTSGPVARAVTVEPAPKIGVETKATGKASGAASAAAGSGSTKGIGSGDRSLGSVAERDGKNDRVTAAPSDAIESRPQGRSQALLKKAPTVNLSSHSRLSWRSRLGRIAGLIVFLILGLWAVLKILDSDVARVDRGQPGASSKAATSVEADRSSREVADSQKRELETLRAQERQVAAKVSELRDLYQARWAAVQTLTGVSKALPELVWLKGLTLDGSEVRLQGRALNTSAIAAFMESLQANQGFLEPEVYGISRDRTEYQFSVDFDLNRDALKSEFKPTAVLLSEEILSSDPVEAKSRLSENLLELRTEHGRLLAGLAVAGAQSKVLLLRRLRSMFESADMTLQSFTPRPINRAGLFPKMDIEVNVLTNYHDLNLFLDRISRFNDLVVVDHLKINGRRGQKPSTDAKLQLSLYFLPEDVSRSELPSDPSERADGSPGIELPEATERDPYRSLVESERTGGERPPGVGGILIVELEIEGIFMLDDGPVAQIQSADGTSYLLRKGDDLFDGAVLEITIDEVIFEQRIESETGSGQSTRRVVKTLVAP